MERPDRCSLRSGRSQFGTFALGSARERIVLKTTRHGDSFPVYPLLTACSLRFPRLGRDRQEAV
ncbi:hypothetical protein A6E15_12040 [Natrinema saccharevitans]|uniref:Uncharacterized protein n=1 Tax=Natrinema saccharevitans TaxID=301967 RepID=A0A1S8AYR6_9EURY|nr:hypothetical protein A6E15_12040 [Natrinema saccharevitans]